MPYAHIYNMNEREAPCPLTIKFFVLNFFSTNYIVIGPDISRRIGTSLHIIILAHDRLAHIIMYLIRV